MPRGFFFIHRAEMIDTRFHHCIDPLPLALLCEKAGHAGLLETRAGEILVHGASDLDDASEASVSFAASEAYRGRLGRTVAAAVVVKEGLVDAVPAGTVPIVAADPYGVFVDILNVLYPDDTARVAAGTAIQSVRKPMVEEGVVIGTGAVLGAGSEIGSGTIIGANTVVGAGVTIGRDCVIGAGVVIECAHLGNGVVLQPGVTIGAEGFGFQMGRDIHKKIPQLGRVIIQDRVEIGANTTVDRGTLGDTTIGEGTKIDNLVQVGHNCRIGRNCVISGMCGLSGSTILEDGVVMGGGAGTAGHLTIGARTVVMARSGVTHDIAPGSTVGGAPAQDVRMWKREIAAIRRLAKGDKT
ncbi:UDP-3-O-(3-hydroxymyristoyl)glucosamine N-acyltransferase [Pelagibacterium limicola]|uniref:UDP-3-O-(3-hydroxymyristoyl)glucosamine N-acyltransferase n=1 Tax=Pelagibacterium limicola TaxID=2791022 RepID=UPI0018AFC1DD|nr:UDP-3-O-(3-hydroxymyristoyl)glucosamine N-acyltransferase [Pelagibacterium limicola]